METIKQFQKTLFILLALMGMSTSIWANTASSANNSTDIDNGKIVLTNEHATFTLSGPTTITSGDGGYSLVEGLAAQSTMDFSLTWSCAPNYVIKVTNIAFWSKAYNWMAGREANIAFNGKNTRVNTAALTSNDGDFAKISESGTFESGIVIQCRNDFKPGFASISPHDFDFYIKNLVITYTITPTAKPEVVTTEETILVKVDGDQLESNTPQTLTLKDYFTADAHLAEAYDFDFTENPGSKGAIANGVFSASAVGTYKVHARVAAKADCHEASAWSDDLTITVEKLDQQLVWVNAEAIQTNMLLGSNQPIAVATTSVLTPTFVSSDPTVLSVENGVLTANKVGEATITASVPADDRYNAIEPIALAFTVREKDTPFFLANGFSAEEPCVINVDSVLANAFTFTHAANPVAHVDVVELNSINNGDEQVIEYNAATNSIIAHNAGKATLYFTQEETTEAYAATSLVYTFTVEKHMPVITWTSEPIYHNSIVENLFSSNNTDTEIVSVASSDEDVATVDGTTLTTYIKNATTTITVTQAENAYWAKLVATKDITPGYPANHVPFVYSETMFNNSSITIEKESKHGMKWDVASHLKLGGDGTGITDKEAYYDGDKYVVVRIEGIPDSISFYYRTNTGLSSSLTSYWYVSESADSATWTEIWHDSRNSSDWVTEPVRKKLSQTTRYIKLCYSGNFAGYFKDVTVTELKQFKASEETMDFGMNILGELVNDTTVKFHYANAGYKTQMSIDDAHFTIVNPDVLDAIGGEKADSAEIVIHYSSDSVYTATDAKLTISDELGNESVVALKARTRLPQAITWIEGADTITYGDIRTNQAVSDAEGVTVLYSTEDENVILVDGAQIEAVGAGEAVVTAYALETEKYAPAETELFITVAKAAQEIEWDLVVDTLVVGDTLEVSAVATSGLEVTLESSNYEVIDVDGFTLYALTEGEAIISARQDGDDNYLAATQLSRAIVVRPEDATWLWNVSADAAKAVKVIRNGKIYIIRGDKTYTAEGQLVK